MKLRKITIKNGICKIPLTQGKFAYCDESDYDLVKDYNWHVRKHSNSKSLWYAQTSIKLNSKKYLLQLHRHLLSIRNPKIEVDHIDNDGLNNKRNNLRACTHQQNSFNQRKKSKGIFWDKSIKRWVANIKINYKSKKLGTFKNKINAIKIYNKNAIKLFGEYANLK